MRNWFHDEEDSDGEPLITVQKELLLKTISYLTEINQAIVVTGVKWHCDRLIQQLEDAIRLSDE